MFDKFEGADFKYDNSFFQIQALEYANKAFLVTNFGIFNYLQILQLDKFEGADFNYDNILLKLKPESTLIKHFWS